MVGEYTTIHPWALAFLLACAPPALAQDDCQPEWSGLNGGADWEVRDLSVFDEGLPVPPPLFAGGGFATFAGRPLVFLARWEGWEASEVGVGLTWTFDSEGPYRLQSLREAQGAVPAGLYVAGGFRDADGLMLNSLARWDGKAWHDVGGGITGQAPYGLTTCIFDEDGDGPLPPCLFVGGIFQFAGGVAANGLARWDGENWSAVGGGVSTGNEPMNNPSVYSLAVFDDGRGPALYVGGDFYYAGGRLAYNIARWDGQAWEAVGGPGGGLKATVESLCVYDEDGDGPKPPALFAGGQFNGAIGDPDHIWHIARWDGQAWTDVGGWLSDGSIRTMAVWKGPDDDRQTLYVGGYLNGLPDLTPVSGIARWDGQSWRQVDYGVSGFGQGTNVNALAVFDEDGDGPNPGGLYVGGLFYYAGNIATRFIARWGCPLSPRCDADLDKNGTLDLFDFLAFVNLFNAREEQADCDGSGAFDLFDFLCFVNAFNAGC